VPRLADYVADVKQAAAFLRRSESQHIVLLGHSMGGLVVVHAEAVVPNLKAVVLSAPAAVPDPDLATPLVCALGRLAGSLLPKARIKMLPANLMCRDAAVVAQYKNDPLVYRGAWSARWIAEMLDGCDASLGKARTASAPLLVVHGQQDRIISMDGTKKLLAAWKAKASVEIVPDAYHETFNEPTREDVYRRIVAWLDATL